MFPHLISKCNLLCQQTVCLALSLLASKLVGWDMSQRGDLSSHICSVSSGSGMVKKMMLGFNPTLKREKWTNAKYIWILSNRLLLLKHVCSMHISHIHVHSQVFAPNITLMLSFYCIDGTTCFNYSDLWSGCLNRLVSEHLKVLYVQFVLSKSFPTAIISIRSPYEKPL